MYELATGRAIYGFLATEAVLAIVCPEDEKRSRIALNAFGCLATALQWMDDMTDWNEDLEIGDENLLLECLKDEGLDAFSHPENDLRSANVGFALHEHSILNVASRNALRWFQFARNRHLEIGNEEIVYYIDERIERVQGVREEVEIQISDIVARAMSSS